MLTSNNRGNPEFGNLPRKFNIAVSGSRDDYAHTHINDIGLQAIEKDGTSVSHRLGIHRGRQAGGPSSLFSIFPTRAHPCHVLTLSPLSPVWCRCDGVQRGAGRVLLDQARGHVGAHGPMGAR
jgi:hypothetical protein